MPRKAKPTISGAPAQPVGPVAGQNYGAGVQQMALQQAMPAPDVRAAGAAAPAPTDQPPAPVAPEGPSDAERFQQAMQAAQAATPEVGLLTRPPERPDEPVTHGLPIGAGAGPEVLAMRRGTPTGDQLRRLTQLTGDPLFARLADRARA